MSRDEPTHLRPCCGLCSKSLIGAAIGRTLVERAGHADLHDVNSMLNFTRQSRRCLIGGVQRALIRTDVQD